MRIMARTDSIKGDILTLQNTVWMYSYNAERGYCIIFNGHNKHSHASLLHKVFCM